MWKGEWRQTFVFDVLKLVIATVLFAAPWVWRLPPAAAWNLSVCGYCVIVASLAGLFAEADWERKVNVCMGAWLLVAPWILGFSHDVTASLLHLLGGGLVAALVALASHADRSPPWQFLPGAALRAHCFGAPPAAGDLPIVGVVAGGRAVSQRARREWHRNVGRRKPLEVRLRRARQFQFNSRSAGSALDLWRAIL